MLYLQINDIQWIVNISSSIIGTRDGKETALREIEFTNTVYFKLDQKWASHVRQSVSVFMFVCVLYPALPFSCWRTVSGMSQVSKRKIEQLLAAVGSALHANTCVYQFKTWCVPIAPLFLYM